MLPQRNTGSYAENNATPATTVLLGMEAAALRIGRCGHGAPRMRRSIFFAGIAGRGKPRIDTTTQQGETNMSVTTIILIILVLLLVGAVPTWPYSSSWGYAPSGILGVIVLIFLVLLLMGRI
jgi:hypothetical protein